MLNLCINHKDVAIPVNQHAALPQNDLHLLGYLEIALHVLRKVARAFLRDGG